MSSQIIKSEDTGEILIISRNINIHNYDTRDDFLWKDTYVAKTHYKCPMLKIKLGCTKEELLRLREEVSKQFKLATMDPGRRIKYEKIIWEFRGEFDARKLNNKLKNDPEGTEPIDIIFNV